jgi:hypothetical protein
MHRSGVEGILALDLATEAELADLKEALARHLDNPHSVVFVGPYIRAWSRRPA